MSSKYSKKLEIGFSVGCEIQKKTRKPAYRHLASLGQLIKGDHEKKPQLQLFYTVNKKKYNLWQIDAKKIHMINLRIHDVFWCP